MKRSLLSLLAVAAIAAAACGGTDKKTAPTTAAPTEPTTAATPKSSSKTPTASKTATSATKDKSGELVGGLFGSVFSNAFGGGSDSGAANGLGAADETLKQYLPSNSDLPDGYTPMGLRTFRGPDGISDTGGIDIAIETATKGDVSSAEDFSKLSMLMAMVMKPDDLQSLGDAFDAIKDLDKEDLEDALTQGATGGSESMFAIKDVKVLDADGLGEGAFGFQMTLDLGGLGSIFGALGDSGSDSGAPDLSELVITVRMYLFSRGDYVGGIMRMAFSDELEDDVDEIALAKIIDRKLKSAH